MVGNEYVLLEGYGEEVNIYQNKDNGFFYLDAGYGWMHAPSKKTLLKFELGEEYSEAVLAHVLKFG